VRFHRRQKRSIDRERPLDSPAGSAEWGGLDPADPRDAPDQALEFQEQFEKLLDLFDDDERQLVELKLLQLTNDETAARMGCSERTVRRLLQRVKTRLQSQLRSLTGKTFFTLLKKPSVTTIRTIIRSNWLITSAK
jgi:RNA polymerase sigma-70 factor, ECF subfamily